MKRTFHAACMAVIVATFAVGCSNQHGPETKGHDHAEGDHVNDVVVASVDEPLAGASLEELLNESDLVLVGEVQARQDGIPFGSGAGTIPYTMFTVAPKTVIKGSANEPVPVFAMTETANGRALEIDGRPDISTQPAIWFLTQMDPQFGYPNAYVMTSVTVGNISGAISRQDPKHLEAAALRESIKLGGYENVLTYLNALSAN